MVVFKNGSAGGTPLSAANLNTLANKDELIDLGTRRAGRCLIGAHVEGVSVAPNTGDNHFNPTRTLEGQIKAKFDIVSTYKPIGTDAATAWNTSMLPELNRDPDRRILWVCEMWKTNATFISEFDSQTGIYPHLVAAFQALVDGGHQDRVFLAPFHEGNGGGNYPWEMYDTASGNSPALYKGAFQRFVTLARSMGVTAKIIQWYLLNNGGSGYDSQNLAEGYAGDAYVDLVGASYYNRADAIGYEGQAWTPMGADIREWYRIVEGFSSRNMWICESGCAASTQGEDKGKWYADLIRLCASTELPRIEGLVMFLQLGSTTDMRLVNDDQRARVGRAVNASRRTPRYDSPADFNTNLVPPTVSVPTDIDAWSTAGTGITLAISAFTPSSMDAGSKSIRFTKPASAGQDPGSDFAFYRTITSSLLDYEPGKPYIITFKARASFGGFRLSGGIRQPGGNAMFSGGVAFRINTTWDTYTAQICTNAEDQGTWRFPYFRCGINPEAGWVEVTDIRISRGVYPSPGVERAIIKRVRAATDAATIQWSCEAADLWTVTLAGNRTLGVPSGAAWDGQEISIRVKQDGTGSRTLALSGFRTSSVTKVISTAPNTTDLLTFQYDALAGKWGLVRCTNWGV